LFNIEQCQKNINLCGFSKKGGEKKASSKLCKAIIIINDPFMYVWLCYLRREQRDRNESSNSSSLFG
jgi:hypothetical protein